MPRSARRSAADHVQPAIDLHRGRFFSSFGFRTQVLAGGENNTMRASQLTTGFTGAEQQTRRGTR